MNAEFRFEYVEPPDPRDSLPHVVGVTCDQLPPVGAKVELRESGRFGWVLEVRYRVVGSGRETALLPVVVLGKTDQA